MKCLILGADGFIGSHFVDRLLDNGFELRVFDRFRDNKSKHLEHLRGKIDFFAGDFLNQENIHNATKDIDIVFHFISLTTPASSINDPFIDIDTNIRGTVKLLETCVRNGVTKLVFSSSGGTIYGNHYCEKFSENDLSQPVSPYGISKLTIERYLEYFKINFGLDYLIFRYSNPYGLRQNLIGSQGVIPIFLNKIKNNEPIVIFGDGENVRDYIFIEDAVDMSMSVLRKNNRFYSTYNVGSGIGISVNDLVCIIEKVTTRKFIIEYKSPRTCDVKRVVLDTARLAQEIGDKELLSLEKGIKIVWENM